MTRVLVTRAREDAHRLVRALEAVGLEVCTCPLVGTEPVPGPACDASSYDWVVFTSRAGVRWGLPRLEGALARVAAVGPGTAEALEEAGLPADVVAPMHSQRGLVEELGADAGEVLFAGAEQAGGELVEELGARHLVVYRTVELDPATVPEADLAVLMSGSAARVLAGQRTDMACVAMGPSTTAEARRCGLDVVGEAASSDLDGLVEAVRVAVSSLP